MSIDQFLRELSKIKGWTLCSNGWIRRDCLCPIEAVLKRQGSGWVQISAYGIGLRPMTGAKIISASDNPTKILSPSQQRLRKRLIKACGLIQGCETRF